MKPVNVIGIGQGKQDLTNAHLALIGKSDLLVGGERHLTLFPEYTGDTLVIKGSLSPIIHKIQKEMVHKKVVVLASGDPLFYGFGSTLSRHISREHLVIHANISSVSAAFAAICQPWHDAKIISLHGQAGQSFVASSLNTENKVAFLTDQAMDPGFIVKQLIKEKIDGFKLCVLENLGDREKEKISWFSDYTKVVERKFAHPNILILLKSGVVERNVSHETYLGMADSFFRHSKGLITKSEIRSISLSKLKLVKKDHVVWDVGSGSGSVGIEASLQIPWGQVFCVEKNRERIPDIIHNIKNFDRPNIKIVNLDFPIGHEDLKSPDRIFIGGGGRNLGQIISICCERIKAQGTIVINTVLIQNMEKAMTELESRGFSPEMIQVQVSRCKPMPFGHRLDALNPVWIISGSKPYSK